MDIKKPFGRNVRAWRSRLGISQEQLAERAGLHRTYICDVERGTRNVSLESIEKLANALGISIPRLLSGQLETSLSGMLDILLVEDLAEDVELTLHALKNAGIRNRIQLARDGAEALSLLLGRDSQGDSPLANPQLILLDLKLPRVDGLEVLRQIKANPRTRPIPVIILTVSIDQQIIAECKRLGADAFIPKPVNFASLSRVTPQLDLGWLLIKPAANPDQCIPAGGDQLTSCGPALGQTNALQGTAIGKAVENAPDVTHGHA